MVTLRVFTSLRSLSSTESLSHPGLFCRLCKSSLISAKQVRVDRRLGYASIALVVFMVVFALALTIRSGLRGFTPPGTTSPLSFMAVKFADVVMFPFFVGVATSLHRRHHRVALFRTLDDGYLTEFSRITVCPRAASIGLSKRPGFTEAPCAAERS